MLLDTLIGDGVVLDPFAGVGRIHELERPGRVTVGVEIELEWAATHPHTVCGDSTSLPFPNETFDYIATSPTYGNRMADHHNARDDSRRFTYKHMLGRDLHPNNSGRMQWGAPYRRLHETVWAECWRVLKPDGRLIINGRFSSRISK